MNKTEWEKKITEMFSEESDRPFADDHDTVVFRHSNNRKWFALMMTIPKRRLGIKEDGTVDVINLKCAPEIMDTLFAEEIGIYPAYHMNKNHWITVLLDGTVTEEMLLWLLSVSYDLTSVKKKKTGNAR